MQCTQCDAPLRPGQRFCEGCGARVEHACPACGTSVDAGAKFCGHCGASLGRARATAAEESQRGVVAERRQLTVLFADLVGSTALSTRLDPEALRDLIRRYQEVCSNAIARYGGHVRQFLGDGVLAYFGHPVAHENDAERAVHAGLAIVALYAFTWPSASNSEAPPQPSDSLPPPAFASQTPDAQPAP